jgi:hypothetical protein
VHGAYGLDGFAVADALARSPVPPTEAADDHRRVLAVLTYLRSGSTNVSETFEGL